MIHRTRFVCFPRSGHGWLIQMLKEAVPGLNYSEHYATGRTLEADPHINAQKTHDFALDVPFNPQFKHVVQFREPVPALLSWWKLTHAEHEPASGFLDFFNEMGKFHKSWGLKWATNSPQIFMLSYENLQAHPERSVEGVINFISDLPDADFRARLAVRLHPAKPTGWKT